MLYYYLDVSFTSISFLKHFWSLTLALRYTYIYIYIYIYIYKLSSVYHNGLKVCSEYSLNAVESILKVILVNGFGNHRLHKQMPTLKMVKFNVLDV